MVPVMGMRMGQKSWGEDDAATTNMAKSKSQRIHWAQLVTIPKNDAPRATRASQTLEIWIPIMTL
jgi:hypothetical protein